jgi:erythromycin esterase
VRSQSVKIGQLARERHAAEGVVLVGFTSYRGTVVAGRSWGAAAERMNVPPARDGSWEDALHAAGAHDRLLILEDAAGEDLMLEPRGHRAIGVVYHPERERLGNYVPTVLPRRYDAVLALEHTHALHPLHQELPPMGEIPETFPVGV